jgi:hypothetical protein
MRQSAMSSLRAGATIILVLRAPFTPSVRLRNHCARALSPLMTLARRRADAAGKHAHVVDYRHVIHALRRKPMALLGLVYPDQLFPRDAYRQTFEGLL